MAILGGSLGGVVAFLDWLGAWPNVPFTIALGATVLFALVQASGVLGMLAGGEGHGDGHADGHGGDADGGDADGDSEQQAHGDAHVGRVPITLTVQIAGVAFGITGLALNTPWVADAVSLPLVSLAWTLPAGVIAAYGSARLIARALAPIVDDRRHAATSRREMIGAIGTVISSRVTEEFGEIRVRDRSGHDVRVVCRLAPGSREMVERDEAVIVDVDDRGALFIAPLDAVATRVDVSEAGEPSKDVVALEEKTRDAR